MHVFNKEYLFYGRNETEAEEIEYPCSIKLRSVVRIHQHNNYGRKKDSFTCDPHWNMDSVNVITVADTVNTESCNQLSFDIGLYACNHNNWCCNIGFINSFRV